MTTPEPVAPAPRRGTPRWLWALLIGSLAFNLLIVGAFAGHRFASRHWRGGESMLAARFLLRDLPDDRRALLRGQVEDIVAAGEEVRKSFNDQRRAAAEAFTAEPFDRARFEAALRGMVDGSALTRTDIIGKMGRLAESLTPDERKRLARRLRFLRPGPGG